MTDIEKLSTLCRVLLSALEEVTESLDIADTFSHREFQDELQDAKCVIEHAKEVLVDFHA